MPYYNDPNPNPCRYSDKDKSLPKLCTTDCSYAYPMHGSCCPCIYESRNEPPASNPGYSIF